MRIAFLIGFPRSGTTWLAKLIDSHPDTIYRHEPFGRHHAAFGARFTKLLFDHGLSNEDFASVLKTLLATNIATEKPPFFAKSYRRFPKLQHALWLGAKAAPLLRPLYRALPTQDAKLLLVKETRSDTNLPSILQGARAEKLIILMRHPYGVIASHLKGIATGRMPPSLAVRTEWISSHDTDISKDTILSMSEAEYIALTWRVQNESYLKIHAVHPDSMLIGYERLMQEHNAELLFRFLGLAMHSQVLGFMEASRASSGGYYSVFRGFDENKWQSVLTREDLQLIDRHTAHLVRKLNLWAPCNDASSNKRLD